MARLAIFAKGNLDVKNSLHSYVQGDKVLWNGINEIVRRLYPGAAVHVQHETWTRSDALLMSDGVVPAEIESRSLSLGSYTAAAQFSQKLFAVECAAIVLSIQTDLTTSLLRRRGCGYFFYPNQSKTWSSDDRNWMRENFERLGPLTPEESLQNYFQIVEKIRRRTQAPILVYNVSAVVPGEDVHCYEGMEESFATRIRRFNLGLVELSERTGIDIIDVDRIVARAGADKLKSDALHLTAEGYELIAQEVVRVLDDHGCFPPARAM
ncbi:SGNH/GDSL hydrolase family protein [Methylocapsa palsarum]|uniref:GDSL-like Lipase/Acylhydrolase family protein n=1 Tax=Methylocapsa palsarum TaxID=1612308 RepID=A0A1I3YTS0_9HYPH|nr:SGNH/GDSL hydrolase family protein [Methylocapsa palsarum]SFK35297.1 GDSL-like Lipase/Acylhydrolase family protein [Methylocapsa palsarum]